MLVIPKMMNNFKLLTIQSRFLIISESVNGASINGTNGDHVNGSNGEKVPAEQEDEHCDACAI